MKKIIFSLAIPVMLLTGLIMTSSCQQEEGLVLIQMEYEEYGSCCGDIVNGDNEREVQIILDGSTADYYCVDDKGLTYEFTYVGNSDYVITETTSEVNPTFCIGAGGNFNLVITYNSSSSPIYPISTVTCQP